MQAEKYTQPFNHWIIQDFMSDTDKIIEALKTEDFVRKECDLFQFFQTKNDLFSSKSAILKKVYNQLSSESFLKEVSKITGKKLSKIDMSAFIYSDTDYLLPHDDRLEGRKIAYVLYVNTLSKSENKGSSLDLFENNKLVKRIFPKKGQLVLFEVSKKSIHQVSEVVNSERITLAGWFHG